MILAGDYLDAKLGAAFAISTMAAAGAFSATSLSPRPVCQLCAYIDKRL